MVRVDISETAWNTRGDENEGRRMPSATVALVQSRELAHSFGFLSAHVEIHLRDLASEH